MLTLRIRKDTFRRILRMPVSFFDKPENNSGTLTSRLSVDCKLISGLTSTIVATNFMNLSSLISGLAIAFLATWELTLVGLVIAPF